MIHLRELRAENAGPYERLVVPLDAQGLVFITGENEMAGGTSNGAGKSFILDLVNDTLLGETAKGEKKDALISWERPDQGLLQELDFAVDDTDYLVRKARKHYRYGTTLQLFRDGKLITRKGLVAAERQLRDEILGLTLDEFYQTTYLTKNFTHLLITGKPAERDLYLTQLFGLNIYQELATLVAGDLKEIQQRLEATRDLEAARRALETRLKSLPTPAAKTDLRTQAARVAQLAAKVRKLERAHDAAVTAVKTRARRESIQEQIAALALPVPLPVSTAVTRKRKRTEFRLQQARDATLFAEQRARLTRKLAAVEKATKYDDRQLRTALAKLERQLERLTEQLPLARRRQALEHDAQQLRQQVPEPHRATRRLARTRQQLGEIDARVADLRTRIKVLQRDVTAHCPTCGHQLRDKQRFVADLHRQCKAAQRSRAALARDQQRLDDAARCATRLHEIEQELAALPARPVDQVQAKLTHARALTEKVRRALTLIEQHTQLSEQLRGLPAVDATIEDPKRLTRRLDRLRELETRLTQHAQLSAKLSALPAPTAVGDASDLHRRLRRRHDQLYAAQQRLDEATRQRREWREVHTQLATQVEQLESLRSVRDVEQALAGLTVAFGRKGLRLQRLRAVIKIIAEHLPVYLDMLFAERRLRFEVTEHEASFGLAAYRNRHRVRLEGFSRGEKARLTLALLLATRLATPPNKHTNALFLDEVFDAIDERGYEGVFTTLRHVLSVGDISSIFLISQNSAAAQKYRRFIDQTWLVRKSPAGVAQLGLGSTE
jgi:DNA repair exonuclease SbcCD ATPase subunit